MLSRIANCAPLALLLAAGCGWGHLPNAGHYDVGALWDPNGVVATPDGLYVPMPHTGGLALVRPDADPVRIDLGEGKMVRTTVPPEGSATSIGAVMERYRCNVKSDKEARKVDVVSDCPSDELQVDDELDLIADGVVTQKIALDGPFDSIAWSDSGNFAMAWIDVDNSAIHGVVNLTSVLVIDAAQGTATPVQVGFAANDALFDEAHGRAIVLSQSSVAVVDLTTSPPSRSVTFPLTLDPDQVVVPVGVALTPDGDHALISVQGRSDLFVLDLVEHSINIVSLDAAPSAMHVDVPDDRTVLVSSTAAVADILDHDVFDIQRVGLDEPMDSIIDGPGFDMLYGRDHRDVYRLDPVTGDLVEFRLQQPLLSLSLAPTGEFAIALTSGVNGGRPGMEVLDLRDDRGHTFPYLLESTGIDVKYVAAEDGSTLHALVLQSGIDYLYSLDLYGGVSEEVDLALPPVAIGAMPGAGFYVTHDDPLGLVSFVDPTTGDVSTVSDFGTMGLFDDIGFVVAPGEE